MTWRIGGSVRRWRRRIALRRRKKKQYAAGETTVEKPLGEKVKKTTFPPSLEIAQRTRDSHFPTVAATAGLRLHFQCLDGRTQGYIFKWLDTGQILTAESESETTPCSGGLPSKLRKRHSGRLHGMILTALCPARYRARVPRSRSSPPLANPVPSGLPPTHPAVRDV